MFGGCACPAAGGMNEIPGKITITKEMIDRARLIVPTSSG
jgi:hypothetical protein